MTRALLRQLAAYRMDRPRSSRMSMATALIHSTVALFPSLEHYQSIRKKLRESGYSVFTRDELWYYHSYDYGWRRVFLNQPAETSPIDEDGTWFNSLMVDRAEVMFLARKNGARDAIARARDEELRREGLGLINEWAQAQGYADIDAYAGGKGIDWIDAYKIGTQAIVAQKVAEVAAKRGVFRSMSDEAAFDAHRKLQQRMGLSATEVKPTFAPTPEEMSASRQQLGIEE